ncbi:BTAD domain-containing putative transcriptional regulator [Amycolatopsis sp. YIM 10]|uniref:AfsR/SARP family transcriptional regulator n=1 Tax=Amycolatopsis sp. YIM 10 TaxID=2653857 RepID=UPI00129086D9|nr:BTAD domain-containing putative transcriptional regulator [Amycolatopsis sp. YIM 10]QFU86783.1 Regulatory protein AfsR [Amycolatopsis sp. YIM 10]
MLRLLGEVVVGEGGPRELGSPRQRCVLAALAVDAGRVVTVERLMQRVWGDDAPVRARETLYSYVSRLRRTCGVTIDRRSGGYTLTAQAVDLHVFRDLCAEARQHQDKAAELLTEALQLWRGEALTGLDGEWAGAERGRLAREHLTARLDLVEARLRWEEGGELLEEVAALAEEHPLDERVAGQLLRALAQSGRRADALEHYRLFRARLIDELGVEPGAALREEHQRLLADSPVTTRPAVVLKQLPAAPALFVGREDELSRLGDAEFSGTLVISAIAGAGGIGKTWLALHWAHRHAAQFPDGQLFVDLRGFAPEGRPMDPATAVRGFLDALGVEKMPSDPHAQAALFRSLVADRRMLLVLDNAAGSAQVAPLLPGGGSCTVVVTSRDRLPGLITGHNARHVPLDVLPGVEARALLTHRIGAERCGAEPEAVDRLTALCGGFPLALAIIAAHAHTRPNTRLADLADDLHDLGLSAFDDGDPATSLPAVLSWSVHALTPRQAEAFRLLALAPGEDIGLEAAVSLTGWARADTRLALRGLEQASLLSQYAHGRYRMHDLVRNHAASTSDRSPETDEALRRVVDFYLYSSVSADKVLNPPREPVVPAPVDVHIPKDTAEAMAWFDAEHGCVLAALHMAAETGWHRTAWNLVWALETYHRRRGLLRLRLEVWQIALAAVEHVPDHAVLTHRLLGRAYADLGWHEKADDHLRQAFDLAVRDDDRTNQIHIHRTRAAARAARGDMHAAYAHAAEALRLCEGLGKPVWQARALNAVGWYAAHLGHHAEAYERCAAALELFERNEDPEGVATTLDSLGFITYGRGDHDQAVAHYEAALARYDELGFVSDMADTYDRLGHAHLALGRPNRTRAAWQLAVELYTAQQRDEDAERVRWQLIELG